MTSSNDWLTLIRKVFLFSTFTGNQLAILAKRMSVVSYPKGAVLFHENDPGDSLYIVLSGSVRVLKSKAPLTHIEMNTLAYLNRGDILGEMALLAAEPRTHTAVVDSTAELLVLTKRDFDSLLEKNPTMAVHLSRILSSRLASIHRSGTPGANPPSRAIALIPTLPAPDRMVFTVNLAVSLAEQTRRKVLLCVADSSDHLIARALGLQTTTVSDQDFREGLLQDTKRFNDALVVHPSGIELLELDSRIFTGVINNVLYSLFALVKDLYDICLFVLPPENKENITILMSEFDKVVLVGGPQGSASDQAHLQQLSEGPLPKKPERVWLSLQSDSAPPNFTPDSRMNWNPEWSHQFLFKGSPFFPTEAAEGQRAMDRLARKLTGLSIGFAMGSGAAFGYALIGMLRVMEREGIFPDVLSGTSMGALIGAFYANGISPDDLEVIAASITRKKLLTMLDFNFPFRTGLIHGNGVLNFLREHLNDKTFNELLLPFACVATDIQTGKEIILDHGNVAEAVRASLSLPFFFQPYYLEGRYLVDGGLVNPVPTSIIVSQGANILLSANLTSRANERKVPRVIGWWRRQMPSILRGPSFPETLLKTIYIMQYEISQARSEIAHVVMNIKSHDLLWWDLDKSKEMIKMGEATAEEVLPKIKSLLPFFSNSCQIHLTRKGRKNY
ncbi:MAG: hypothetical protein KCHDKBKB_02724 [Elusimicrobia bacterium]|nr:hypothetical protein [Elusimicrobiota bacterium]